MNKFRYEVNMPKDKGVKYDSFRYPGGEVQVRLKADQLELIKQSDQFIVTAHINNGDIMELASMTSAINGVKPEGFHFSHLILPYLPYARADRRFTPGDAAGLETFMKLVKQLGYKYIWSFDVHSPAAKALGVMNIYPERFIERAVNDIGRSSLAILLPDKGAVRYDIEHLGLPVYQASKVREPVTGKLTHFEVPSIAESKVLIVDDICDGGGTFVGISEAIQKADTGKFIGDVHAQEHELYLYVSHGIFSKGLAPLSDFKRIYTTDSFSSKYSDLDYYNTTLTVYPVREGV